MFLWVLLLAKKLGMTIQFSHLAGARSGWEVNQLWVVTGLLMTAVSCFSVYTFPALGRLGKAIVIVVIAAWVMFHLGLGNRRDFTALMFFSMAYVSERLQVRIRPIHVTVLAGALLGFLYLGIVRLDARTNLDSKEIIKIALIQNEFGVPIETAGFYATYPKTDFKLGETYFRTPAYFIPRALWQGKPISLSFQYSLDRFGTTQWQGYAFTPITEAFLNFAWVGPFMVMALLGFMANGLVRFKGINYGYYLIFLSMVPDFNRGEAAAIMYALVIILDPLEPSSAWREFSLTIPKWETGPYESSNGGRTHSVDREHGIGGVMHW